MRRVLSLLLILSLAFGGSAGCCLPQVADDAVQTTSGGCHDAGEHDDRVVPGDQDADQGSGSSMGCGSCTHCVTSAPLTVMVQVVLMAPPQGVTVLELSDTGRSAYAPPLRPPIPAPADLIA